MPLKSRLVFAASLLFLAACSGGNNGGGGAIVFTPPSGSGNTPVWTQGTFENSDNFASRCQVPRTGTNPATNSPYPDVSGSTTFENFWLRSWSDETYLWYNEITDQNPASFNNRLTYFEELKTFATTASGTPKDQFHFTIPTDEYQQRVSSGAAAGYGAEFALVSPSVPREIRVAFTQAGTAAAGNLFRGTEILEIDGVDAINGTDTAALNAGLFPENPNEAHTFLVRDIGSMATRTVTLTSQTVNEAAVQTSSVIDTPTGKVGYLHFTTFGISTAEQALLNAMTDFSNQGVSDLIIDLRYNGGGFLSIASEMAFMVAGSARTNSRTFDKLTFSDKHPVTNPVTGATLAPTPFYSNGQDFTVSPAVSLPSLNLGRVFILSTARTCSASEAVINGLRGIDVEVILIGTRTCGKPYGFYATDNCGETYFTIQFKGENDKGFGDYADGFTPMDDPAMIGEAITGCLVPDDFSNPLGDESEKLLETALAYRSDGKCPSTTTQEQWVDDSWRDPATSLLNERRIKIRDLLETSRILDAGQ